MKLAALFLSFLLVTTAASPAADETTLLRLHGSNTIGARLAPALAEAWLKSRGLRDIGRRSMGHEEQVVTARDARGRTVAVEIHAHGSGTAFTALGAGSADLGMSSRPIKRDELAQLAALGLLSTPHAEYVLGLDGIAVIVHPSNPIQALDKGMVARIFAGEVRDWSQIGGAPGAIRVYARDDKSGTFDTFKALVLDKMALTGEARRFESSMELSDAVAQDPGGIGFIGLPYVRQAKAIAIRERDTAALLPTTFTVATEDYALARRLFFYLPPKSANPLAKSLADFAISAEGQAVVAREGFVSQAVLTGTVELPPEAPDEYRQLTQKAWRLSLNFRFREGSPIPDNKAVRDLQRLVEYMQRAENRKRQLILSGFSDHHEVIPLYSLDLSIQRADTIADMLLDKGVRPLRVRGYGSAVPVASDDTALGRQKNRRVEVWVR